MNLVKQRPQYDEVQIKGLTVFRIFAIIQTRTQFFSSLEERHMFLADFYRITCARIATRASFAFAHRKSTEPTKLHPVTSFQCRCDFIKDHIDNPFHFAWTHFSVFFCEFGYEF